MKVRQTIKQNKKFLFFLFVFSFIVRAAVFYFYLGEDDNFWQVDSNTYHVTAVELSKGNGFSLPNGKANFYRLPGYSVFLAGYYKLFGEDKKNVLWMQILLASLIPLLIFLLALALFPSGRFLAKIASMYSSIHLGLVMYSGFFMTESLFIFFLLLFFICFFSVTHCFFCSKRRSKRIKEISSPCSQIPYIPEEGGSGPAYVTLYEKMYGKDLAKQQSCYQQFTRAPEQKSYLFLLLAGLFLGVATLIRPVGHYLIVLAIITLLFSKNWWEDKIGKSITIFLGWLIPVLFWIIRNYLLIGHIFLHTLPGGHFLYFSAARVAMHVHDVSYKQSCNMLRKNVETIRKKIEKNLKRKLNEFELCKIREKLALSYFYKKPLLTVKTWMTDMFRTCFSLYSAELLHLDSGRKEIQYFDKKRTIWSLFKRYLVPDTNNRFLKIIIFLEIMSFFFILLGFLLFMISSGIKLFKLHEIKSFCSLIKTLPFMALFIVISLAGGYARMRLPIEPFLMIFSFSYWIQAKQGS